MASQRSYPIRKQFSFHYPVTKGNEEAVRDALMAHFIGFSWVTGREIVAWLSEEHGAIQVWAVDEAEGRGVIEHALAFLGADEADGEWVVSHCSSPRFGKVATVVIDHIAVRAGSDGWGAIAERL